MTKMSYRGDKSDVFACMSNFYGDMVSERCSYTYFSPLGGTNYLIKVLDV